MGVTYDEKKFVELLLLVAGRLQGQPSGGVTKLNKVLYFAEFRHLRRYGRAISGCEFKKKEHGPTPHRLLPVRARLIANGEAELIGDDSLGLQQGLVPLRDSDLSVFDDEELDTIERVLDRVAGMTDAQASDLSHQEAGWRLTEFGETIPHEAAFLLSEQVQTPTSIRLEREVAERYGLPVSG